MQNISTSPEPDSLPPYKYPVWIIVFTLFTASVFLIAAASIPKAIQAKKDLKEAQAYSDKGDYRNAIASYTQALGNYPDSSEARFNLAIVYFKLGDKGANQKALQLLDGVYLNENRLKQLHEVMPEEYWSETEKRIQNRSKRKRH
jgi:tetratricopeptide (TPR) repeat protein